jgi:pimeloyl-ACP methyl ester carboxylesterase
MRVLLLLCLVATACAHSRAPEGALDPRLTTFSYPYPVRTAIVATQRQRLEMAYIDAQPTGAAKGTVVLLHGKNFSAGYWARTIEALTAVGFRVIAPDQIGFGKSAKPATYQFSFEALADNTRQLLDHAGATGPVIVVGHSMGGMLAVRFALMYPARVAKLALINPIGLEDWRAKGVPSATIDELYATELAATPDSIREYMRQAYFAGDWRPAYDELVTILAGWTKHPHYREVAWNAALTSDMVFTQPVVHELSRISTPTLLIIGERDRTAIGKQRAPAALAATLGDYAALGRAAADAIPGATLVALPGVGHVPQVEAWDAYRDALLGFVQR